MAERKAASTSQQLGNFEVLQVVADASPKDDCRRSQILNAAERCFIASGFHGARMSQIAKEAKMSPGHIYHYFESKERIIAEMVRSHAEDKKCMLNDYEAAGDRVVDMMIENLDSSVDSSTDPFWSALMLEITAEATRNPEIATMLRESDDEIKARVLECLMDGTDKQELETRLELLVALFQGLGIRNIINPELDKKLVAKLMKDIVELLFRSEEKASAR